jgi:TrmH family RNA methyltransferase
MGALFRVLFDFDEPSGRRIALVPRGGTPLAELELDGGTIFVLGAEREGLPGEVLERCDERASIPQSGESLNVAMAGTIALYEWSRRQP